MRARGLCSSARPDPKATVRGLASQQGSTAANLGTDLAAKLELLVACEREFGLRIPHAAMSNIQTVEDAASYWEHRLESVRLAEEAAAAHWTQTHLPNVTVIRDANRLDREVKLQEWLEKQEGEDGLGGHGR